MKRIYLHIIFILSLLSLKAQDEAIFNRQRAIFLHNFTRQIGWPQPFEVFKIGVLGSDQILPEIERFISKGRLVQGRPMELVRLNEIEEIEDVQLVYVNQELGYDMTALLSQVEGKGILVVSENYPYNSSMINMALVDDAFQFEIQQNRLEAENFKLTDSFKKLAISTANRWQELYMQSRESLEKEKKKVKAQKDLIIKQEDIIKNQSDRISSKTKELNRITDELKVLEAESRVQKKRFEQRTNELDSLEIRYVNRLSEVLSKQEEISKLDSTLNARQAEIELQSTELASQATQIETQKATLKYQRQQLDYQKNFTILLGGVATLMFVTGFFIWKNYREKKKSNLVLEQKNTEIEATSKELKMVNKEMEQFAYLASHDLQEPLSTITGWIQMIDINKLDERGQLSVELISSATERMRMLIKGLLEYSQLGSHIEFEEVDCNVLVEEVLSNLTRVIDENSVTMNVAQLPLIKGHPLKLGMLFQNLISNATKFKKEGVNPVIEISAKKVQNGMYQFSIKDNGIGIKEENLQSIFDIFHREHSRDQYEGTGIGLAHVRKIIEMHKGKIWVESTLGEGTTFHFTLLAC